MIHFYNLRKLNLLKVLKKKSKKNKKIYDLGNLIFYLQKDKSKMIRQIMIKKDQVKMIL